jgi:hypothetical protein
MVSRAPAGVPSATIVEILREAVHSLDDQTHSNDFQMFQYHLEKLLTELDKRNDVDEKTIAQLEWLYLPLLRHSKRPPKTLHKSLSESPTFFVEVLKTVYRSSLEADAAEKETDEDERHNRSPAEAISAEFAEAPHAVTPAWVKRRRLAAEFEWRPNYLQLANVLLGLYLQASEEKLYPESNAFDRVESAQMT